MTEVSRIVAEGPAPRRMTPPGFDENPTAFRRRASLAVLAFAGLIVASYLTLFQLKAFESVWDPFFDSRTVLELTAPVPDAFGGVMAYGTELLLLALGGRDRWRSLPWACLALGAVLSAGAVVSIGLVVVQPTIADAWCTLCLVSAGLSILLFVFGIGESRAAWRYIVLARRHGVPTGDAFWGRAAAAATFDGTRRR